MTVYILDWGLSSYYRSNIECVAKCVFLTREEAKIKADTYPASNRPSIVKFNLETHAVVEDRQSFKVKKVKVSVDNNVYYDDIDFDDIPF